MVATIVFATRDNLVRWLAIDTDVSARRRRGRDARRGGALMAVFVARRAALRSAAVMRARFAARRASSSALSYVCLFEAYYRGLVTVVSPLVATESLWGVVLSAIVLGSSERVGVRLLAGAVLWSAGGVLIGSFR